MDVKRTESPAADEAPQKTTSKKQGVTKTSRQQHREEVVDLHAEQRQKIGQMQDKHTRQLTQERIKQKNSVETQRTTAQKKYQQAAAEQAKQEATLRQESKASLQAKEGEFQKQHSDFEKTKHKEAQLAQDSFRTQQVEMKDKSETAIKTQKDGYKKDFDEDQRYFEDYRTSQRDFYGEQIDGEKEHFQKQAHGREDHFQNRFNENEVRYQGILEEQRLKYEDAYEKSKFEHLEKMKQYNVGKDDPFYRVKDLGARMNSEGAFYQVALPVPEHELKNFKIHVQPDRITVSGQRKFEDEQKFEGEKLSTNSYQTVKQEFALATPADKDLVRREYQNGILYVTAPKKGFGIF